MRFQLYIIELSIVSRVSSAILLFSLPSNLSILPRDKLLSLSEKKFEREFRFCRIW